VATLKVRWTPKAADDLEAVVAYLAERHPGAARRLAASVLDRVDRLANGTFEGPEQTLRTGETVRSWPVRPLRIYYQRGEQLVVLRVYHQRRVPITR
jgi:plasmid stabilization system protein ParE